MRSNLRSGVFLSVAFAVLLFCASFFSVNGYCAGSSGNALIITDVHFNPYYDTSLFSSLKSNAASAWEGIFEGSSVSAVSAYSSEANYPLLKAALDSAAQQVPNPKFIIFPGDILGHGFNSYFYSLHGSTDETALKSFILKTVTFFALEVQKRFPNAPVFFTLGNNDAYLGDYLLAAGGAYLNDTAEPLYTAFLENRATCTDYTSTYKAGGYFRADLGSMIVLSLNSVLFSSHRPTPTAGDAAWTQLSWFAAQLALARAQGLPVVVVTHVPPGIDIYSTARYYLGSDGKLSDVSLMWHSEYNERFLSIVEEYADVITMVYAGHTHMDEFRIMEGTNNVQIPVWVTPSVSPIFHNNPGYRVLETRSDGASLENYQVFTMSLQATSKAFAQLYDFQQQYRLSAPDATGLPKLNTQLYRIESSKDAYISHYYGDVSDYEVITDAKWPVYYCGITSMRKDAMLDCVNNYVPAASALQFERDMTSVRRSWLQEQ